MKGAEDKGQDQWLLDVSLVLLVIYNGLFLLDVIFNGEGLGRWAATFMAFIDARRGWVTLFEVIAALSVFVDLIVRFDAYENRPPQCPCHRHCHLHGRIGVQGLHLLPELGIPRVTPVLQDLNRPTGIHSRRPPTFLAGT